MAEEKSKMVYGILAIVLGWLGIHKFYVGDTKNGIIHLALTICLWIISIGPLVSWVIGLISGIKALTGTDADFHQKYVVEKKLI